MPRPVALRINGAPVQKARILKDDKGWRLLITDPILGQFSPGESFTFELLELVIPPERRRRLPHDGWRKVPLRILIPLLGNRAVRIEDCL